VARFLILAIDPLALRHLQPDRRRDDVPGVPEAAAGLPCVSSGEFVWLPAEFLHKEGSIPIRRSTHPTSFPSGIRARPAWLYQISSRKAFDAGWTQRPFTETALDCLWWMDSLDRATFRWPTRSHQRSSRGC